MLEGIVSVLEGSRIFLPSLLPLFFTMSFLLLVTFFVLNFRNIRKQFKVKRFTWMILILIFLLGISLRILTPIYMTTYNDEFAHMDTGKNIVTYGRADVCTVGYTDFEKKDCGLFNEPAGFPYVVGLFFLFLGVSETSAYAVNVIMGSLLTVMVFLFCFLLFRNEKTGLYSAFVVSILPLYILLSRNIEPDPVSAFFILLTFLSFLLFFKIRDVKTGVFATSILAFSMSIKQENILLIPLVFLLAILFVDLKNLKQTVKNYKSWFLAVLFIILVTPHVFHLSLELYPALFYGKTTATAVGGQVIKMENIVMNAQILNKVINGSFYPILINLFLVIGLIYAFKKHRRVGIFLIIFFSLYMFVYLAYSATIVEKYLITGLIPLICFAGVGMYAVEEFVVSKLRGISRESVVNFAIPLVIFLVLFLFFVPYFYEIREGSKPLNVRHGYPRDILHYNEREAIKMMDEKIDNCYIVAEEPIYFSLTDLKIMRTDYVLFMFDQNIVRNVIDNGGCIFYFEDFFCTDFYGLGDRCGIENPSIETCEELRQVIISRCRIMHEKYQLHPYLEYEFDNFTFTVYNISVSP